MTYQEMTFSNFIGALWVLQKNLHRIDEATGKSYEAQIEPLKAVLHKTKAWVIVEPKNQPKLRIYISKSHSNHVNYYTIGRERHLLDISASYLIKDLYLNWR